MRQMLRMVAVTKNSMQYATFKVTDIEAINAFLTEKAGKFAEDGITYADGQICVIYENRTDAEIERDLAIAATQVFINTRLSELMGHDIDVRYWRRLNLKGAKGAAQNILNLEEQKENLLIQIGHARNMVTEMRMGTWLEGDSK